MEPIDTLIERMRSDPQESSRRWGQPFAWAEESARRGRLFLRCNSWVHHLELDAEGRMHVLVGETPEDARERPLANAREANFAWFGAVEQYPELRPFLPTRPEDATSCAECAGTGTPPWRAAHPCVACTCGGAGWLPQGAEAMELFADGLEEWGAATDTATQADRGMLATLRRWWQRLRDA